jgi:transcriptional regulator with XRE-family HTH domain
MPITRSRAQEIIKTLREKNSLTQKEFGERTGFSQGMIMFWENGKKSLSEKAVTKICKAFNVDPALFYTQPKFDSSQEQDFMNKFRSLNRADQELVSVILNKMILLQRLSGKNTADKKG